MSENSSPALIGYLELALANAKRGNLGMAIEYSQMAICEAQVLLPLPKEVAQ